MKIAVLLPQSTTHPQLGYDFYSALQICLQTKGLEIEWHSASIGFGTDENEMISKAEDFILNKQVDVLVAFADFPKISGLANLLSATHVPLFVVNMGAKLPADWVGHPMMYYLTAQETLLSHLTGKLITEPQAIIAANYYEGGYSPCQIMINSFMTTGGEILYNFIPHTVKPEFELNEVDTFLAEYQQPLAMMCFYSSPLTAVFWEQWETMQHREQIYLYAGSTFLMESLRHHKDQLKQTNCMGLVAWHKGIETIENKSYLQLFEEKNKRNATCFGALGWDLGIVLHHYLTQQNTSFDDVEITRGKVSYDKDFQTIIAPAYQLTTGGNLLDFQFIPTSKLYEAWIDFKETNPEPITTGWVNTYLCS